MASISTDAKGNRKIQFVSGNSKRKSVYLGKTTKADCKEICSKIEAILAATLSRRSLAPEVAEWVGNVPDVLANKLAAVGLIPPRAKCQEGATKLGEFIDAYLLSRADIKPRTRINLLQVRKNLVTHFGEDKQLAEIAPGDTDEWRRWMLGTRKLGHNTVRRHCGRAKQLLRAALRNATDYRKPIC